jgi:hypothetical protein
MRNYHEAPSRGNPEPRPRNAELLAIPAVRAIRRRVAVTPTIAVVIAGLLGLDVEVRDV